MNKEFNLLYDIFFYFILPILFWKVGRMYFSDYITILISAVPGIFYSLYRFFASEGINFTRIFLFVNIVNGLITDLCSGSALQLLWNDAYYSLGLCILYLASCFTSRPLYFYFSFDILVLQGYDKKITKEFFLKKEAQRIFIIISLVNSICELAYSVFLMKNLPRYGVEIYTFTLLADQIISFFMSAVFVIGFFNLYKLMYEMVVVNKLISRKKRIKLPKHWYSYLFESCYFIIRKHFH